MPVVHATMRFAGGRIKGLVPAVDPDEPQRKAEAGEGGPGGGEPGADGKSAYQSWLDIGNSGSEVDFIASLKSTEPGPPGDQGEPGADSTVPGPPGDQGEPGISFFQRRVQTVAGVSGTVACDWSLYDEIRLALTGNVALTFSGAADGQGCTLKISQDAAGSRTVALPGNVRYSTDITGYAPSTAGSKTDRIGFIHDAGDSKYDFVSVIKGF